MAKSLTGYSRPEHNSPTTSADRHKHLPPAGQPLVAPIQQGPANRRSSLRMAAPIPAPPPAASLDLHNRQQVILHTNPPPLSLVPPSPCRPRRPARIIRLFRTLCRALPIFTLRCQAISSAIIPTSACSSFTSSLFLDGRSSPHSLLAGTLFGYRKGRISFSLQENAGCLPSFVVQLPMQSYSLLREMSAGMVRIALECARDHRRPAPRLLEEPVWAMFCNGKKSGYAEKREATEEDLAVLETLRAVSMGAGVLPGRSQAEGPDGEMAYVRSSFEHVIASRDSESLYMVSPDEGKGPDLTIFFVRL